MSLSSEFLESAPIAFRKPARPAPFSIRLSEPEKSDLSARAGERPLSVYIRECLFAGDTPRRARQSGIAIKDKDALAKALALLGRSRLANNLNQIAYAVNIGALPMTPETEDDLRASIAEVREMRQLLLAALGMKSGGRQ